jgi:hypothetical protein
VLTPAGRFPSVASAARHHKVCKDTVLRWIREGYWGWQFEEPYQLPAGFTPLGSSGWRKLGPRKREKPP